MRLQIFSILTSFLFLIPFSVFGETGMTAQVKLSPTGNFQAKTSTIKGSVTKKGTAFTATSVIVSMSSLVTGLELRDKHMKEKYLEVAKFPQAEIIQVSGKDGIGRGNLRFHGVEKTITGTYKILGKELIATFPIKLSEFNITGIKYMGVGVKDDVEVVVTLPFTETP